MADNSVPQATDQPPAPLPTAIVQTAGADLPALRAHLVAPHMVDYRSRVKDLVKMVQLQILEPA